MKFRRCVAAATLLGTLAGCGPDRDAAAGVTVTDSAGVRIVTSPWNGQWDVPEWTLEETPEFAVGDAAPSDEYELYRVYYARSFPDGRVVVSMNLTEVRIYSPAGEHLLGLAARARARASSSSCGTHIRWETPSSGPWTSPTGRRRSSTPTPES